MAKVILGKVTKTSGARFIRVPKHEQTLESGDTVVFTKVEQRMLDDMLLKKESAVTDEKISH